MIAAIFFGFLGFAFYQRNFGRWKADRMFDPSQHEPPTVSRFLEGLAGGPLVDTGAEPHPGPEGPPAGTARGGRQG